MKAQMLKIAGVKTEKAFYKKYPTEAAFFKAHPEAKKLVKAQMGAYIGGNTPANPEMLNYQEYFDEADKMITGSTAEERQKAAEAAKANSSGGEGGGMDMSGIMDMVGQAKGIMGSGGARNGSDIPMAQDGFSSFWNNIGNIKAPILQGPEQAPSNDFYQNYNPYGIAANPGATGLNNPPVAAPQKTPFDFAQAIPIVGGVMGALNAFGAEKKARKQAQQAKALSEVTLAASRTRPEQIQRRYVTPWDNPVQPGQMFPVNGVGTNVLAKDGAEIQNTYAPGTLYDDLGYAPLNNPDQVKQYYYGGGIPRAQYGIASAGGAGLGQNPYGNMVGGFFDNNAGSQMGGALGSAFGPIGGAAGSLIGGALDQAFGDAGKISKYRKAAERNMQNMAMNNMAPGIQAGYASHMKEGGDTPKRKETPKSNKVNAATRADSLFLLKNNKIIKNLQKNGYKWSDNNNIKDKSGWNTTYNYLKKELPKVIKEDIKGKQKTKPYNTYIDERGKFLGTQDWLPGGGEDYYMPKQYIHPDIVPQYQGDLERNNINGNHAIYSYGYDDLAITPFDMLSEKQKIERVQKYGTNGVPKSYLKKNNITPSNPNDQQFVSVPQERNIVNFANSLQPQGIDSNLEFNTDLPYIPNRQPAPQYYDIEDKINSNFGGGQSNYQWYPGNGDPLQELGPGNTRSMVPHYEEGGYVSNDWTPQVITQFGGLDEQDFYNYAHEGMDSLRSGGHLRGDYTPVSARGLQTYAMGGELKTHWGGHAETMSHNPFLPGDGETVMFRGQSHDESDGKGNTGIGITYGNNPVEVERGEPAVKLKDGGTNEENLTVYGNLQIPNEYVPLLGDPKAKGKKFKNYVAQISKDEARQNKTIENSTNMLNDLDVRTPFDKLKFDALTANINGANMKLKDIADKKINAAHLQNAINDTAEEYGLVADDLAKGKAKFNPDVLQGYAKTGKTITTTNETTSFPSEKDAKDSGYLWTGKYNEKGKKIYKIKAKISSPSSKESNTAEAMDYIPKQSLDKSTGLYGGVTPAQFEEFKNKNQWYPKFKDNTFDPNNPDHVDDLAKAFNAKAEAIGSSARILPDDKKTGKTKYVGKQVVSANLNKAKTSTPGEDVEDYATIDENDNRFKTTDYKRSKWMDIANQFLPFIRPTDQEPLDPNQLLGEMYALSNNQVEPVQAQSYQPDLGTPYDISYQDMLNANQADYNATQKMLGYNPSGLAQLNAQKYAANEKVLGEQFRQNQAMKAGVYDKNRDILNDAKLKNLGIYDQQYTRQSQAVSNTKAIAQAALNSISDKYAKNKAANRELGIYENMYNYRYDPAGRAINMNPLFQPNMPNSVYAKQTDPNYLPVYDAEGNQTGWKPSLAGPGIVPDENTAKTSRLGAAIKKTAKNGSIVKLYKNT